MKQIFLMNNNNLHISGGGGLDFRVGLSENISHPNSAHERYLSADYIPGWERVRVISKHITLKKVYDKVTNSYPTLTHPNSFEH